MFLTLSLSAGNHCQVALNLFQHLIESICHETLKRVQGDEKGITTQPHRGEGPSQGILIV